jgi:hypothetical protein
MKLIKCICLANGEPGPAEQFLSAYNPKTGESEWTWVREKALTFPNAREAMRLWRSVLETDPVRWDGKANRPLTAFTVEVVDADKL